MIAAELGGSYALGPGIRLSGALQGVHGWGDDGNENFDGIAFTAGTSLNY